MQKYDILGTSTRISTITRESDNDLCEGDPIILDDGLFELKEKETCSIEVICEVIVGGILKSSKGINLP